VSTKSVERPGAREIACARFCPLPIKLYLYRELLFELYNGGETRRKAATACVKVYAGIYRSGNCVFEVQNGGQTRYDLEIEWERLGFHADAAPVTQPDFRPLLALHQKRPRNSSRQGNQLTLWTLDKK
jgi:hypothetical protein